MPRIRTIVMVLAAGTLVSQRALGADARAQSGELVRNGQSSYAELGNGGDAESDDRDRGAMDRSLHDSRRLLRLDPYDRGYDDPLCDPDFRDYSSSDCPWR